MNPHAERYCPAAMLDRQSNLSVPDGHLRFLPLHTCGALRRGVVCFVPVPKFSLNEALCISIIRAVRTIAWHFSG
jgi:hypothetical protein